MLNGDVVYCDCCGTEKLAQVVGDALVIKDRRHGEKHVAVIPISAILDILKKTVDNSSNDPEAAGVAGSDPGGL